ncbi:efflux RND transporter periplasmic adaptor subunit [Pseudobythopirellula maris]|nr:efflux RND transporter periplasmic adaptor subunit [Pseudobythopirellula maris]
MLLSLGLALTSSGLAWGGEPVVVEGVVLRLITEAEAPSRASGALEAVLVREGDTVRRGQALARIDDAEARLALLAAEARRAIAEQAARNDVQLRFSAKAGETAAAELARSRESIERFAKSISQSQIDVERLKVEQAELEHEQAEENHKEALLELKLREHELSVAKLEVERRQITAPFGGVVVESFVRLGEWVEPGQRAFRLVDTSTLKAEGFVEASRATAVHPGDVVRLELTGAGPPTVVEGRLAFVSPEVDPINAQVRVWAEVDNRHGRLRPGARGEMTISIGESQGRGDRQPRDAGEHREAPR